MYASVCMHVHVEVSARMGVCSCVRRVYINCVLSKINLRV